MDVRRVFNATFEDIFVDFHRGAAIPEGGETAEHFEDEDAKRPPACIALAHGRKTILQRWRQANGKGDIPVDGLIVAL